MSSVKAVIARDLEDLAGLLGLSAAEAAQMEVRRQITDKIIKTVAAAGLTHAQVAKAAGTSRARLTAILNRNTAQVSTDLMLRILGVLGYQARIAFRRSRAA